MNWWDTAMKRLYAMIAMGITGWHIISTQFGVYPLPEFVTTKYVGNFSILTVAAGFTLFSIWLLAFGHINK